jgi:hypothetical protein
MNNMFKAFGILMAVGVGSTILFLMASSGGGGSGSVNTNQVPQDYSGRNLLTQADIIEQQSQFGGKRRRSKRRAQKNKKYTKKRY